MSINLSLFASNILTVPLNRITTVWEESQKGKVDENLPTKL